MLPRRRALPLHEEQQAEVVEEFWIVRPIDLQVIPLVLKVPHVHVHLLRDPAQFFIHRVVVGLAFGL